MLIDYHKLVSHILQEKIFKLLTLIVFILFLQRINAQIKLTHNTGDTPIATDMYSCEDDDEHWARIFKLSDFGISRSDQFIINSMQTAISRSYGGAYLLFAIYSIDSDYPNSRPSALGHRYYVAPRVVDGPPEIIQVDFSTPIIVPTGVERILVEIIKVNDPYNDNPAQVYIAGTAEDTGISYYKGCNDLYTYTPTTDLGVPNANYFINVTGEKFNTASAGATTILSHSDCDNLIKSGQYACSYGGLKYARTFTLEDFGISTNEEFMINRGQVAFSSVGVWNVKIQFNIYKIDDNFPDSLSDADLLGSSQIVDIPYFSSPPIPEIFNVDFDVPVVVPADVEKILVEVYNIPDASSSAYAFIAGTEQSSGLSWLKSEAGGCPPLGEYKSTAEMGNPHINYYIRAIGESRDVSIPFNMEISNNCSDFFKSFGVTNKIKVSSIEWNFGDPSSGAENSSLELNPVHDFTSNGTYTISATITDNNGKIYTIEETINITEPPYAYEIEDIFACEDHFGTGISSTFNASGIHDRIVNGRTNILVSYIDGNGRELPSPLPDNISNTIPNTETISVRLSYENQPCCYSETTFDLIVSPLPDISGIQDIVHCDNDYDGYAEFSLSQLQTDLKSKNPNSKVTFFHQNGDEILNPDMVSNKIKQEELITVSVTNFDSNCSIEATFKLIVSPIPIAHQLDSLIGCDDNNDGISEYFDTSNVESQVLNGQTGMTVSYFDHEGNQLSGPLSNPYTNSEPFNQDITVRVTNSITGCFAETILELRTSTQPKINKPHDIYACDLGNGYAEFNTEHIEKQIIGNQQGVTVHYFDDNGNSLASPLPKLFSNTVPHVQTIYVKVEDISSSICYTETSFDLIVNSLPIIDLEKEYFICDSEPFISLSVSPGYNTYEWYFEDGNLISSTYEANVKKEGDYTLRVTEEVNNIICQNEFSFSLTHSNLANIDQVNYGVLGNNYIEIIATGSGNFEYSINGTDYQDSNYFENLAGGTYHVFVRDIDGCGKDSKVISIIDYPKFFTPNGDGYNDKWQLNGSKSLDYHTVDIYDRYGRLLIKLDRNSEGWDGKLYSNNLPSGDYWFKLNMVQGKDVIGHFSLIR